MRLLLPIALLAACGSQVADADSVITILGNLKTMRGAAVDIFDITATALAEAGDKAESDKWKAWSNDWLSLLGVNKGLTGLTKDFVLNYLGRSAYHDQNGPLVEAIQLVGKAVPRKGTGADEATALVLRDKLLTVCEAGVEIFKDDGSMHQMLTEARGLFAQKNTPAFAKGLQASTELRKFFEYMAGPRPDDGGDEEL